MLHLVLRKVRQSQRSGAQHPGVVHSSRTMCAPFYTCKPFRFTDAKKLGKLKLLAQRHAATVTSQMSPPWSSLPFCRCNKKAFKKQPRELEGWQGAQGVPGSHRGAKFVSPLLLCSQHPQEVAPASQEPSLAGTCTHLHTCT